MRIRNGTLPAAFLVLAGGALAAGCASQPRPTEEMTRAKTLIETAEQRGAPQYAGVELEQAHKKLGDAEAASSAGKQEVARRLAVESGLDAELQPPRPVPDRRSTTQRRSIKASRRSAASKP